MGRMGTRSLLAHWPRSQSSSKAPPPVPPPSLPPPSLPPPSLPPPCRTNRLLALALDQPADYFDAKFSHPTCTLRPIHYTAEGSDPNNGLFAAGALRARTGWGTHLPACRATRMGLLMMRSTAMPLLMAQ